MAVRKAEKKASKKKASSGVSDYVAALEEENRVLRALVQEAAVVGEGMQASFKEMKRALDAETVRLQGAWRDVGAARKALRGGR